MQRSVPDMEAPEDYYDDDGGADNKQRQKQKLVDPGLTEALQNEIEERNLRVKQMESDALDILELYTRIQQLIAMQREKIDDAADNINEANLSVQKGDTTLLLADEYGKGQIKNNVV